MAMRHVAHFYHSASRMIEAGLYSLQVPRLRREPRHSPPVPGLSGSRKSARRPKPLFIHYHIFKNAGSSVEKTLQQNFGASLHLYDAPAPDGLLTAEDIETYVSHNPAVKAISTHQATLPPPDIPSRNVTSGILIRDPIARIQSMYLFEKQQSHFSLGGNKAKELDFKDYVEWRLSASPSSMCNYQVHFCSRTKDRRYDKPDFADLQRAIANLEKIDLVGTVERYSEWLSLAQWLLSKQFRRLSLTVVHENISVPRNDHAPATILHGLEKELGPSLLERLLQCNYLDQCLYRVADSRLTQSMRANLKHFVVR
jgi:Sulfotransferase family